MKKISVLIFIIMIIAVNLFSAEICGYIKAFSINESGGHNVILDSDQFIFDTSGTLIEGIDTLVLNDSANKKEILASLLMAKVEGWIVKFEVSSVANLEPILSIEAPITMPDIIPFNFALNRPAYLSNGGIITEINDGDLNTLWKTTVNEGFPNTVKIYLERERIFNKIKMNFSSSTPNFELSFDIYYSDIDDNYKLLTSFNNYSDTELNYDFSSVSGKWIKIVVTDINTFASNLNRKSYNVRNANYNYNNFDKNNLVYFIAAGGGGGGGGGDPPPPSDWVGIAEFELYSE